MIHVSVTDLLVSDIHFHQLPVLVDETHDFNGEAAAMANSFRSNTENGSRTDMTNSV